MSLTVCGGNVSKQHSAVTTATATQELPIQTVIDFFSQGTPITQAPSDVVLKKSNAAIRVISSLGLLERKIIDACFFIARPRMCDNILHSADLEYFKWLLSFNSQNREHLKKAITKIQQTLMQINIVDASNPGKDFWHSTNFIYDVSIANGRFYFRIPESIRQPLMDPKSWTYLSFRIKNRFTSEYAYILYERCRAEQFRGATDWWPLAEFREIMNTSDLYQQFQDLRKRVIDPAISQINEHSDIYIAADYQTRGRSKTHIRFIIEENPNVAKFVEDKENLPTGMFNTLKKVFGFSNSQIDEVAKYPIEYLTDKMAFSEYRIKTSKNKIGRPDLYLMKALKEDLRFNDSEIKSFEASQKEQERQELAESQKQMEKESVKKGSDHLVTFDALDESEKQELIAEFKVSTHFTAIKRYAGGGNDVDLGRPMVKVAFANYLQDRVNVEV